jgi:hypothetical protein
MSTPSWYSEATLVAKNGHWISAGTLVQCVRRWKRMNAPERISAIIKMGRDGVAPVVLHASDIQALSENPEMVKY